KYHLVVDLSGTETMDSAGIGALVCRIAATRSSGGDIRLASPGSFVLKLLEITHLDQIFKCYDTVEEASKSFRKQRGE
ncbi:STAS domain-containing protein, partial [Thermodesulfobacteriota bacterium]